MILHDTLKNIRSSWDDYHSIDDLELIYPETISIVLFKNAINRGDFVNQLIDFGCGSGQHHSIAKNLDKIIGIDYSDNALKRCSKKSTKFRGLNIDLTKLQICNEFFNNNNFSTSIITGFQIFDHLRKPDSLNLLNLIAKSSAPYIIFSLFTDRCVGQRVRGEYNPKIDAYISPISMSLPEKIEMHSFFSPEEINNIKEEFINNGYQLVKKIKTSVEHISPESYSVETSDSPDIMETIYLFFSKKEKETS